MLIMHTGEMVAHATRHALWGHTGCDVYISPAQGENIKNASMHCRHFTNYRIAFALYSRSFNSLRLRVYHA